ncbi:MAG: peptidoglycan DD-metalloendopeptidase family protein [Lachnospiraceae bacterium]|nr:peptidoglycan DD-metalloendopeptidase family protein [Lachnospiraceae bacterium]
MKENEGLKGLIVRLVSAFVGTAFVCAFIFQTGKLASSSLSVEATSGSTEKSQGASEEDEDKSDDKDKSNEDMLNRIKDMENQVDDAKKERDKLNSSLTNVKNLKKDLEQKKNDLTEYVQTLDANLTEIQENIDELNAEIAQKEQEIADTQNELELALGEEESQKSAMYFRIRRMYEKGSGALMELFVQSGDLNEFMNNADYMGLVVNYDHLRWQELISIREYIELVEEALEIERENLETARENVKAEEASLEELIDQKNKDISAYQSDINTKSAAIKEYEASIAQQNAEIKALEDAIAEERRQILENNGTLLTYDGGTFKFPLESYTRVSDDYGNRIHPILGTQQFHNGVDFAAPAGTGILAAYDGKVIAATYSSSMGNYVMIDHGDELYTIYMHASALYVKKGDTVAKGQKIAAVGSTGRSTGNHLHFSVRKDGAYTSPWNYLSH